MCTDTLLKRTDQQNPCWSQFFENSAYWFDNPSRDPSVPNYPRNFVAKKYQLNGNALWRHIAIVYDETDDHFRLYFDGALAHRQKYGSSVKNMDACTGSNPRLMIGRMDPGWYLFMYVMHTRGLMDVRSFLLSQRIEYFNDS